MKFFVGFFFVLTFSFSQIISYELKESWSISEVQQLYNTYGIPMEAGQINFPVDGYKILYFTPDYTGELVLCSGAIYLPKETLCPSPILSFQHGTEVNDEGVPSNVGDNYNDITGVIAASHGYIVTMSDFVGLGDGPGFHHYVHSETEASSTIDLILLGKQFADDQGVAPSNQLFLMGYSQGGHATMAAVREIEQNYSELLQVTGSAPMAGPYSMSGAQREMLEAGLPYPNPGYLPYVLFAYDYIYDLYDDITEVLQSPYSEYLFDMYSGQYDMFDINQTLPTIPIEIFQTEYYENYLNDDNHPFKLALMDNDILDFVPQSPMRLLHCSGDDNVAYENSVIAYNTFLEAGAEDVSLVDGGNFGHVACASLAIIGGKIWIDSMAEICEPESVDILDVNYSKTRKLIGIFDLLGRKQKNTQINNQVLIYFYDDGTYEKRCPIFEQ